MNIVNLLAFCFCMLAFSLESPGLVQDHLTHAEGGQTETDGGQGERGSRHHLLTVRWLRIGESKGVLGNLSRFHGLNQCV